MLGIVPIVLLGSVLHFAFEWSGGWGPLALVAAVNESVWEHLKLAFWPGVLWALFVHWLARPPTAAYLLAKAFGLLAVPLNVIVLYYGYKALLGRNILAFDIGIFVVAVAVGQLGAAVLFARLERHSAAWIGRLGAALLLVQLMAYSLFTYLPPQLGLFEEERTGRYGIPATVRALEHHD